MGDFCSCFFFQKIQNRCCSARFLKGKDFGFDVVYTVIVFLIGFGGYRPFCTNGSDGFHDEICLDKVIVFQGNHTLFPRYGLYHDLVDVDWKGDIVFLPFTNILELFFCIFIRVGSGCKIF